MFVNDSSDSCVRRLVNTRPSTLNALSTETWFDGVARTTMATAYNCGCVVLRRSQWSHTLYTWFCRGSRSRDWSCWRNFVSLGSSSVLTDPPNISVKKSSKSSLRSESVRDSFATVDDAAGCTCWIRCQVSRMKPWIRNENKKKSKFENEIREVSVYTWAWRQMFNIYCYLNFNFLIRCEKCWPAVIETRIKEERHFEGSWST